MGERRGEGGGYMRHIYECVNEVSVCGDICVHQGCSTEAQVLSDNKVELLWQAVENTPRALTHTCSVAFY